MDSETGKGATFHVFLPASDKPAEVAAVKEEAAEPQHGEGRILLMDDEEFVRFRDDTSFANYKHIDDLLKSPEVARDLATAAEPEDEPEDEPKDEDV